VSKRREALIARYREISLERLRSIRAKLDAVAGGNTEALAEVRRELHTLKGDSHLLGLVRIGEVAHACEERIQPPNDLATAPRPIGRALDAIKTALRDETADRSAFDGLLRNAIVELAEGPGHSPSSDPAASAPAIVLPPPEPPTPRPAAPVAPGIVVEAPGKPARRAAPSEASRWIHVNAHDVDAVCERLSALHADLGKIHATLRGVLSGARDTMHDVERLRADLDEIVSSAWALRLAPVYPALSELGEHALDLAQAHGKELRVRIDDGGALVERRLLDEMREPLLHLVRNAVDHGIEPASERGDKPVPAELVLSAVGSGGQVVITVADDGRGIDVATVRQAAIARGLIDAATPLSEEAARELLFVHGFSTRQGATNLSGRGIGLDAVRRRLTAVGGRVSVSNNPGGGTRFAIQIPSTVFRERVLIADVGGALCALPAREVEAVVQVASAMIESVGSTPLLRYQGEGIPVLPLPLFRGSADSTRAAIVSHAGRRWAISLPEVVGDVELLRVPVDAAVASLGPFAASGTLDDGRLVLVVSLDALLSRPRQIADIARTVVRERSRRRVLVVDDSPIVRDLLSELLSSVGLSVRVAGDGAAALQQLAEDSVDLIVCDVEMPVMDGFELLRRLRERADRVPVVMVTTRGSLSDRAMAASLGADALIVKSEFENAHLLETVRRFVEIGA
jgi:chemotaxis protein histidine kinase CheA